MNCKNENHSQKRRNLGEEQRCKEEEDEVTSDYWKKLNSRK